jgi:hypothetical protein
MLDSEVYGFIRNQGHICKNLAQADSGTIFLRYEEAVPSKLTKPSVHTKSNTQTHIISTGYTVIA